VPTEILDLKIENEVSFFKEEEMCFFSQHEIGMRSSA
jgi:hypothetical protein